MSVRGNEKEDADEKQNVEKNHRQVAKKTKKIVLIVALVVFVCAVLSAVLIVVIIPKQKLDKAMNLLSVGKYDEGYTLLEELNEFDTIASSKYDRAIDLIKEKDYENAYLILRNLNYKDSADKADSLLAKYPEIAQVGDVVKFGQYEQDDDPLNGKEEIEWVVLAKENGKILILSKYALDCQRYYVSHTDVTWETCSLRGWLNTVFYHTAFNSREQTMISLTNVKTVKNPQSNATPGSNTEDKVFLLSMRDVETYFPDGTLSGWKYRRCEPTFYAEVNGAKAFDGVCAWYLRSPGDDQRSVVCVGENGSVDFTSVDVCRDDVAVRPAMWISSASLDLIES